MSRRTCGAFRSPSEPARWRMLGGRRWLMMQRCPFLSPAPRTRWSQPATGNQTTRSLYRRLFGYLLFIASRIFFVWNVGKQKYQGRRQSFVGSERDVHDTEVAFEYMAPVDFVVKRKPAWRGADWVCSPERLTTSHTVVHDSAPIRRRQ